MNTNIEFTFNYYNKTFTLSKNYLSKTKLKIGEIVLEEALKQTINLNIGNIVIYDFEKQIKINNINEIITSDTKKYKIIIKPVVCNCHYNIDDTNILISKY